MRLGINFVANPKYYVGHESPEIVFKFVATRTFLASLGILDDDRKVSVFLYKFGFYEFKKWLNELDDVKSITNELEYNSQYTEAFRKHILNGDVLVPVDSEDEDRLQQISEEIILKEYNDNRGRDKIDYDILKEIAFVPDDIFKYTLNFLKESNFVNEEKGVLTPSGIAYFKDNLNTVLPQSKFSQTVFVAQSFHEDMVKFYKEVYEPLVREYGLNPILISNEESSEPIDVEILNQIRICRFMICDLTYSRPSVYFEAGYALGRGVNVVYACKSDHNSDDSAFDAKVNKVHFDIRNRKISWWNIDNIEEFKNELKARINYFLDSQK